MTRFDIALCGRLAFTVDGEDREHGLRGRQGRLLFAYLVLHRHRALRRDELVEALWAGDGRAPSETALAPVLSRLRGALAPGTVTGRAQLALALPGDVVVDVEEARALLGRARELTGAAAVDAAARAAALVEAGLLPGLEAPWLAAPRDELADLRVDALELAARAGLEVDPAAAERAARAAVAAAPFRESARITLMEALRARGNVAEALRAHEELRTLLRDELGTIPGPEVIALHEQLLGLSEPVAAAPPPAPPGLVEREGELRDVEGALARLEAGGGGAVVFEGPAGIGKTRLLEELRARALARGVPVLSARAGVLERDYGFGVVRQLFAATVAADPGVLEGPAAPARAAVADAAGTGTGDGTFAVLDGLFHLTLAIAGGRPLVVWVDDLQWSDAASLRFAAYLTRRIAGVPVLLAASVRSGEPDVDDALLAELAHDPATTAVRPGPLSGGATLTLVRRRVGAAAEPVFAEACHQVTAGNPLLLGQLLTALDAEHVPPDREHAQQVRDVGPRAVSRTVLLRLARLPEPVVAVARAVATLGEQPPLAALAALAETTETAAADAVGALARADILRAEEPLGFVHPLVRDAVYHELPAAVRSLEHLRAARVLAELGARPESIAAQLQRTPPRGDPWVVDQLRTAAAVARRRGAPDAALAFLERAQAEPPPPAERSALALELGELAELTRGTAAVEPLREALRGLEDPAARAETALRLGRMLAFVGSPEEGIALAQAALADLPPELEDLRQALEALRILGVFFGVVDPAELVHLEPVRHGPRGAGPGAKTMIALAAVATAAGGGPASEAAALGREALEDDVLLAFDPGIFSMGAVQALMLAEPSEGLAAADRIDRFARRRGSVLDAIGTQLWGGLARILSGDLLEATEALEQAFEGELLFGAQVSTTMGYTPAFLARTWLERGDPERAWAALRATGEHEGASDGERFWMASHAELLLDAGRASEVLPIAEHLRVTRPPDSHPVWSPWMSLRARALADLGRGDEAAAQAAEQVALAERIGADWIIGSSLRLLGALERDAGRLREAVRLLDRGSARLERAKAHAALAEVTSGAEAAAAWSTARALALRCGAERLAAAGPR